MNNTDEINRKIREVISKYQSERVSGQWYIEQTGLNKVAKLIGGDYKALTKKQKIEFRSDCLDKAFDYIEVRNWNYYLNCA